MKARWVSASRWSSWALLAALGAAKKCAGITPTGVLSVRASSVSNGAVGAEYSLLGSQASFGPVPAMGSGLGGGGEGAMLPPSDDRLLCGSYPGEAGGSKGVMVVARGGCTFELKALNAQRLGASGIVIYGTLGSRYSVNETSGQVLYPKDKFDYDCSYGQATLPPADLDTLALPYDSSNDALLTGSSQANLCVKNSPAFATTCASQRCLLTGADGNACCAWDLHVWLYADPSLHTDAKDQVAIPALYVTMQQAQALLRDIQDPASLVRLRIHSRQRPTYNLSALLIWALGVLVAFIAAKLSAADYRAPMRSPHPSQPLTPTPASSAAQERTYQQATPAQAAHPESLELTPMHALAFILMASSALLLLFFLKVYNLVKVMYAFGCSGALTQVFFYPLYTKLFAKTNRKHYMNQVCTNISICEIGQVTRIELLSALSGYALGLSWLLVAFLLHHPENNAFFWIVQDLMGACMCILFLSIIKLNSIRVASILLIVAFLYDIFFVFITPLIFKGQSVMITVATSGGPPKADPSWCEKYPHDNDCQGGDPLPMLLTVPRINDYQGGASLLGLGDIVLPGLLLSFAARFDEAKKLVGFMRSPDRTPVNRAPHTCPTDSTTGILCASLCNGGYFPPLVIAYAVGLLSANIAVYLMNMGQPALLYLVPACLGTMLFLGKRRNELDELWHGPRVIRAADAMIYGEDHEHQQHDDEFIQSDNAESGSVGSGSAGVPSGTVDDGPVGDVPLLSLT